MATRHASFNQNVRQMGMTYTIDHPRRIVRSRGWGTLTIEAIEEFYSRLQSDPAFDPEYRSLGDLREVTEIAITPNDLAASASLPVFAEGTRRALLATDEAVYGALRAYARHNEGLGQTVRVFRDRDAAEAWLDGGEDVLWRGS